MKRTTNEKVSYVCIYFLLNDIVSEMAVVLLKVMNKLHILKVQRRLRNFNGRKNNVKRLMRWFIVFIKNIMLILFFFYLFNFFVLSNTNIITANSSNTSEEHFAGFVLRITINVCD